MRSNWIVKEYRAYAGLILICEICGHDEIHNRPNPRFCAGCGAIMENHDSSFQLMLSNYISKDFREKVR